MRETHPGSQVRHPSLLGWGHRFTEAFAAWQRLVKRWQAIASSKPLPNREGWRTCEPGRVNTRWAVPLLLLLLTGCGDDRPYTGPPPSPPQAQAAPSPASSDTITPSSAPPAATAPADPLIGDSQQTRADPLIGHDPLQGSVMPTAHSHWLNAVMRQARVTVLLNGVRLGQSIMPGTQDVTMKMRPGINTMTVLYTPQNEHSWGSVTMSEGEHGSQAVVLAAFRREPQAEPFLSGSGEAQAPKTISQTFTFSAK